MKAGNVQTENERPSFFMSVVGVDRLDLIEWDVHDFLKTRKSSSGRGMVRW